MIGDTRTSLRRFGLAVILGLIVASAGSLVQASAPTTQKQKSNAFRKDSPQVLEAFRSVVAEPSKATVRILADGEKAALGAIVGPDGWILTKASLLNGDLHVRLKDGREFPARIVGVHKHYDLAMLKIEARNLPTIRWADSSVAPVGNWVASPGVDRLPVAIGVVSVAARTVPNAKGAKPTPESGAGFLGISLEEAEEGVKVSQVLPGSGAAKAGVRVNDIIVSAQNKTIDKPENIDKPEKLINLIMRCKPGDSVVLLIKRDGKELKMQAKLGKRPRSRGEFQNNLGSKLSKVRSGFPKILQHDSVIKPEDCGGPLVDLEGRAIGINVARAGRTESYAIATEHILPILYDLMSGKLPPRQSEVSAENLSPQQKVEAARAALRKAEEEKRAADKRLQEARQALQRAEAEARAAKDPTGQSQD
ncbi:MAG: serine protease [Gemmatales bacterium]|nr:MAG: serine protease [Gemmatales bacterium]